MGKGIYPLQFQGQRQDMKQDYEQIAQLFQNYLNPVISHPLPPDLEEFTGRFAEVDQVLAVVEPDNLTNQIPLKRVGIVGRAGIGKSALALHLAHRLKPYFPQKQTLYIDLRGTEPYPASAEEVAARLFRSQGMKAADLPETPAERLRLIHRWFAQKDFLLILDNAADANQVLPLIPVEGHGLVIITSRHSLPELENAKIITLSELSQFEANEFLNRSVNRDLIRLEIETAQEVVDLCDRLPLALNLVAGYLKHQSSPTLVQSVEQLRKERQQVEQLRLSLADIRPVFKLSYQQLSSQAASLLRLLGLLSHVHFSLSLAATLLEVGLNEASQIVGQLADGKLVRRLGGGHYCIIHDSVRLLARGQLAMEETPEERQVARLRICRWYIDACDVIKLGLHPSSSTHLAQVINSSKRQPLAKVEQQLWTEALNWFEQERSNLLNAVEWAYQAGAWEEVIALSESLVHFFNSLDLYPHWEQTHQRAIEAAQQLGDQRKEAQILNNLANAYLRQNQLDKAQSCYEQSIAQFLRLGAVEPAAKTLANSGILFMQQGELEQAIQQWKTALFQLPEASPEQRELQQWMQTSHPPLWQALQATWDNQEAASGWWRSVGKKIKQWVLE